MHLKSKVKSERNNKKFDSNYWGYNSFIVKGLSWNEDGKINSRDEVDVYSTLLETLTKPEFLHCWKDIPVGNVIIQRDTFQRPLSLMRSRECWHILQYPKSKWFVIWYYQSCCDRGDSALLCQGRCKINNFYIQRYDCSGGLKPESCSSILTAYG